jgi:hypothetical protein
VKPGKARLINYFLKPANFGTTNQEVIKMKKCILVLAMMGLTNLASADSPWVSIIKDSWPACINEDLFDEMVQAITRKDVDHATYLLGNGCIITKPGIKASVIDGGFGTAKVRLYLGKKSVIVWMNTEAVMK